MSGHRHPNNTAPPVGAKLKFACPLCGGADKGDATYKLGRDGRLRWFLGCWACPPDRYPALLAERVGAPGGGALLDDPQRWLVGLATPAGTGHREPEPLPSVGTVAGWHSRLLADRLALHYLRKQRGITKPVIERYGLGWDGEAFTLPVRDIRTGELVNVRRRRWPHPWPGGSRYRGLRGRTLENGGIQPYPDVPPAGPLILCAGDFDALILRRHRLPGVTVPAGSGVRWKADWNDVVAGRPIAVVFDADPREEAQAESRAAQLREAGAQAWVVRLSQAGLRHKEDITDWFITYGRGAGDFKRLLNQSSKSRKKVPKVKNSTRRRRGGRRDSNGNHPA